MNLFGMMDASGEAMQAERVRAEVVAANMANAGNDAHRDRRSLPPAARGLCLRWRRFRFPRFNEYGLGSAGIGRHTGELVILIRPGGDGWCGRCAWGTHRAGG